MKAFYLSRKAELLARRNGGSWEVGARWFDNFPSQHTAAATAAAAAAAAACLLAHVYKENADLLPVNAHSWLSAPAPLPLTPRGSKLTARHNPRAVLGTRADMHVEVRVE